MPKRAGLTSEATGVRPLTKTEREALYQRFDGRCAYCGDKLGKRWNADHVEPIGRIHRYEPANWRAGIKERYVFTGKLSYPERDCFENLQPSCIRCNNNKSNSSLESWRARLQNLTNVLGRNYSAYYHAKRFGLVIEPPVKVVFFFERNRRRIIHYPS